MPTSSTLPNDAASVRALVSGDPVALLVALTLAGELDAAGVADVTVRRLAELTGYHTATVGRAVRRLADLGALVVLEGHGNRYQMGPVDKSFVALQMGPVDNAQVARPERATGRIILRAHRAPRARNLRVQSAQLARSGRATAPVVVIPNRAAEKKTTTTTETELAEHARTALGLLAGYIDHEATSRPGILNRNAYRNAVTNRARATLAEHQADELDPYRLARFVDVHVTDPAEHAATVAARLAAAGAGTSTTRDDEHRPDDTPRLHPDRIKALLAAARSDCFT